MVRAAGTAGSAARRSGLGVLSCLPQRVAGSASSREPDGNGGCKQESEKMDLQYRMGLWDLMGECSGVSLATLEIRGESLTVVVPLFGSPLGVSSFLYAGEKVAGSLLPAALLRSISGRLRLTASVVVSIYTRLAPLTAHSSVQHRANVSIADFPSRAQGRWVLCSEHERAARSGGKRS